jgi:hypothetical protein
VNWKNGCSFFETIGILKPDRLTLSKAGAFISSSCSVLLPVELSSWPVLFSVELGNVDLIGRCISAAVAGTTDSRIPLQLEFGIPPKL